MRRKIKETIDRYQMFEKGDRVITGVSGGADSIALLAFLWEYQQEIPIVPCACHVNHSLRGAESDRDEDFVRTFCKERQIPLTVFRIDAAGGAKRAGLSVELYSRQERYRLFEELAAQHPGPAKIATAHTLSDQAETVLFRLGRGTGLKGLEGIPPVRGRIVRPLIDCTRQEVEQFCRENQLDYVTDSTNLSDDYARNQIRHHGIPALEAVCPGLYDGIRRMTETVRRDNRCLDRYAEETYYRLTLGGDNLSCKDLLSCDPALQYRIAGLLLESMGIKPSQKQREQVLTIVQAGHGAVEVSKGNRIVCSQGRLFQKQETAPQEYFEVSLESVQKEIFGTDLLPETGLSWKIPVFPGKVINILLCEYEKYKKFQKIGPDILKKSLDYDRIGDIAAARQRREGDRICFPPHSHSRTLKKIMNEAKIPIEERGRRIILCDGQGPVWVEGFGCADRAALSEQSRRILILDIEETDWESHRG